MSAVSESLSTTHTVPAASTPSLAETPKPADGGPNKKKKARKLKRHTRVAEPTAVRHPCGRNWADDHQVEFLTLYTKRYKQFDATADKETRTALIKVAISHFLTIWTYENWNNRDFVPQKPFGDFIAKEVGIEGDSEVSEAEKKYRDDLAGVSDYTFVYRISAYLSS
jgi:hypothetical protein